MKKKTLIITVAVLAVVVITIIVLAKINNKEDMSLLYATADKGQFEIVVSTTGELQAENSTDIKGPEGLGGRNMRFRDITIQDLIPEGTIVKAGDYVATLDKSDADNSLKDEQDNLENMRNDYEMAKLDTTISLGDLRDQLMNLKFNMEEASITLEQSKYEPPTTIRQNQINLDKTTRAYEQAQKNYVLKVAQAKADMRDAKIDLDKQEEKVKTMEEILQQFTVVAPADGMVIYKREWSGAKRKVGSSISPFDPVVATLPDLSQMISKTYVNEIDISKIKTGQKVRITVDAFPEKRYTGEVISVANIGEQLPNTDAKVFEVVIKLNESDPILRPSMTTGNQVVTNVYNDVVYIPLECVHATADSIPFVYTKNKEMQVVVLGDSNENEVIVEQGVEPGDQLYLSTPEDAEDFKMKGEELISVIKEKEKEEKAIQEQQRRDSAAARSDRQRMSSDRMQQFQNMTDEERQQMRQNMQNMTDEERQQMRQNFQGGRRGGQTGGSGQGRTGGQSNQNSPVNQ